MASAFAVERWDPAILGEYGGLTAAASAGDVSPLSIALPLEALAPWIDSVGPVAVIDLETTGLPDSRSSEILEIGMILLDPGETTVGVASTLVRPGRSIPSVISRITGISMKTWPMRRAFRRSAKMFTRALNGRLLVAHQADFEKSFLSREVHPLLGSARYLDTQEILSLAYPDAPDLRLETFARMLLDREEQHRAFGDALDAACVLGEIARSGQESSERALKVRRILDEHLPASPWRGLFETRGAEPSGTGRAVFAGDAPENIFAGDDEEGGVGFEAFATGARRAEKEPDAVNQGDGGSESAEPALDRRFLTIGAK